MQGGILYKDDVVYAGHVLGGSNRTYLGHLVAEPRRRGWVRLMQVMKCSFCDQTQEERPEGRRLIGGPRGVAICSDCVRLCVEVLDATLPEDAPPGRRVVIDNDGSPQDSN